LCGGRLPDRGERIIRSSSPFWRKSCQCLHWRNLVIRQSFRYGWWRIPNSRLCGHSCWGIPNSRLCRYRRWGIPNSRLCWYGRWRVQNGRLCWPRRRLIWWKSLRRIPSWWCSDPTGLCRLLLWTLRRLLLWTLCRLLDWTLCRIWSRGKGHRYNDSF
jgi:hypothetical protein